MVSIGTVEIPYIYCDRTDRYNQKFLVRIGVFNIRNIVQALGGRAKCSQVATPKNPDRASE